MVRRRVVVCGQVQGVGYRAACARVAVGLGVSGRVRNLDDGRVEVVVSGPLDAVERFVEWCRLGPRGARVDDVVVTDEPTSRERLTGEGFEVIQ